MNKRPQLQLNFAKTISVNFGMALLLSISCGDACDEPNLSDSIAHKINSESDLIGGPNAESRIGDYILDNGTVRFVLQRPGSATGWGVHGGSLVDIDSYDDQTMAGHNEDHFQELFFHCNLRAFKAKSVDIISVGNANEPGILRFTGVDGGFPLLDSLIPSNPEHLETSVDLILHPNAETLEIIQRAKDTQKTQPRDLNCGLVLIRGDAYHGFIETKGREVEDVTGEIPYFAASSQGPTSFVLYREKGLFDTLATQSEVLVLFAETKSLLANDTREEKYFLSIGRNGDIESALEEKRKQIPDSVERHNVRILMSSAANLMNLLPKVVLRAAQIGSDDRRDAITEVKLSKSGEANIKLANGSYELSLSLDGQILSKIIIEVSGDMTQKIPLSGLGTVRCSSKAKLLSGDTIDTPVRLNFLNGHDVVPKHRGSLRRYVQANETFWMIPGDYTLVASKGPEFEFDVQNISVKDGEEINVVVRVEQVVDSAGWVSGDFHVHGARSMDSRADRNLRVIGAIAEGLDILVATDHDVTTDYGPYAKALGLDTLIHTIPGIEVSPLYGHMNAYPLPVEEKEPYWNVKWWEYDENEKYSRVLSPAELVAEIRLQDVEIVSLNHPRGSQALFEFLELDDRGTVKGQWPNVDAFELMNDTGGSEIPQLINDWMALFKVNRRLTALGVSDSHGEFGLGYSRTYIQLANDNASSIDESKLWPNMRAGKVVASSGPFVRFSSSETGPVTGIGDTLSASGAVDFDVEVQAPSWMSIKTVRFMENGTSIDRVNLDAANTEVIRLQHTFTATPTKDSLYFVIVEGEPGDRHSLVIEGEARAITNPIFVDVDGNGFSYTP